MSRDTCCENCGLPSYAISGAGRTFPLTFKASTPFQRDTKRKVWCCSGECSVQALAQAKYGTTTHRWPVTLAEFRQMEGIPFLKRLDRYENPTQVTDSGDQKTGQGEFLIPEAIGNFRNARRPPGRPSKGIALSPAERMRKYRWRKRTLRGVM